MDWFEHVKDLVSSTNGKAARDALDELTTIANGLARSMTRTQHRIAINLRSLGLPEEASELPAWAKIEVHDEYIARRVERALRVVATILPPDVVAIVEDSPHGVAVDWKSPLGYLQTWVFRSTELPWPGLNVEVITPSEGSPKLVSRRYYDAQRLLEQFREALQAAFLLPP